jgi:rhomboid protease GluP
MAMTKKLRQLSAGLQGRRGETMEAPGRAPGTFAAYLAKYYIAKKGFRLRTVPEAQALETACDAVLTYSDSLSFRIICIVDCETDPTRHFGLSPEAVAAIGEQCRKYTGRVAHSKMPVTIDIFEIGPNAINSARQYLLQQFAEVSSARKVNIASWIVDPSSRAVWTNAALNGVFRGRRLIQRLLRAPPLAEADLRPVTVVVRQPGLPFATYGLLAVLTAVFVVECLVSIDPSSKVWEPNVRTLLALGGLNWNAMAAQHEWYRLLSATFLHGNVLHFLLNSIALYFAAAPLERLLGTMWLLTIYLLTALGGSMLSLALNPPNIVSVGASGAIMGLFAAGLVCSYRFPPGIYRTQLHSNALPVLIPGLLPLTSVSAAGHIDFAAHLGGALTGAVLGAAMLAIWPPTTALPRFRPVAATISIAGLLAAIGAGALAVNSYIKARQAGSLTVALIPQNQYPKTAAEVKTQADALVARYPRDPRAHYFKSLVFLEAKDFDGAIRELKTALNEQDILDNMLPPRFKGVLQLTLAAALTDRATRSRLSGNLDQALGDHNEVIQINVYGLNIDPNSRELMLKLIPFYERGRTLFLKGDYAAAIVDYDEAIRLDPKHADAWNSRCWTRAVIGRELEKAVSDCDESLRLRPNHAVTLDSRGFAYLKSGQFDKAIADYDAALKIDPRQADSLYGRGVARRRKGDTGGAFDIATAMRIRPNIVAEFERYGIR